MLGCVFKNLRASAAALQHAQHQAGVSETSLSFSLSLSLSLYPITFYSTLPYPTPPFPTLPYPILPYPTLTYPFPPFSSPPYPALPFPTQTYPTPLKPRGKNLQASAAALEYAQHEAGVSYPTLFYPIAGFDQIGHKPCHV